MIILAFDTCLDKTYVVLKRDNDILASKFIENHDSKYHSAFLISTIQKILSENSIKPQSIDLIATNIGPGSFTGIRACTTVARVMAQQLNCKVIGISSLEILANTGLENPIIALDARKDSAYLYYNEEIKGAVKLDEIKKLIKADNFNIITDKKLQNILGGIAYEEQNYPLGEILANLALEKIEKSNGDWKDLKPLYIQPPPVFK